MLSEPGNKADHGILEEEEKVYCENCKYFKWVCGPVCKAPDTVERNPYNHTIEYVNQTTTYDNRFGDCDRYEPKLILKIKNFLEGLL